MLAYSLKRHGKPGVLVPQTMADPSPANGEVLVAIEHIGVNYAEIQSRKGLYAWSPDMPYIPGMESSGHIIALGEGVTDRQVGEKVIVVGQIGSYAEKIAIPSRQALPALKQYSSEENAAFAVNFMTAWVGLKKMLRLKKGETVLIQAAAGGVGTAAVQLAYSMGLEVYGTASTKEKCRLVEQLGARHCIQYSEEDFESRIRDYTDGEGLDAVIEVVGGEVFYKSMELLKPFGRLAVMGFASLNLKKWNPLSWYRTYKSIPRVKFVQLGQVSRMVGASHLGYLLKNEKLLPQVWAELVDFVSEHQIKPVVGHTMNFEEMAEAHQLMESRQSHGKIVLSVD